MVSTLCNLQLNVSFESKFIVKTVVHNMKHKNYKLSESKLSHKTLAHDIFSSYQLLETISTYKAIAHNIKFLTYQLLKKKLRRRKHWNIIRIIITYNISKYVLKKIDRMKYRSMIKNNLLLKSKFTVRSNGA
jgi:hypothetical protein